MDSELRTKTPSSRILRRCHNTIHVHCRKSTVDGDLPPPYSTKPLTLMTRSSSFSIRCPSSDGADDDVSTEFEFLASQPGHASTYVKPTGEATDEARASVGINTTLQLVKRRGLPVSASQRSIMNDCGQQDACIPDVERRLSEALGVIEQQKLLIQSLRADVAGLHQSSQDLSRENDDLVNDINDVINESDAIKRQLEDCHKRVELGASKEAELLKERDSLVKEVGTLRERNMDMFNANEVTAIFNRLGEEMKNKIEEAAQEKTALEVKVKQLALDRDRKQQAIDQITEERKEMDVKICQMGNDLGHRIRRSRSERWNSKNEETALAKKDNALSAVLVQWCNHSS